jgi:adenylate cyclase
VKKNDRIGIWISFIVAVVVMVAWFLGWFQRVESASLDARFNLRGSLPPPTDIAIVAIDEDSIKALGRWPWPRSLHADLLNYLTKAGARSVLFDVLFTEPDTGNSRADRSFGKAIAAAGNVTLDSFFQHTTQEGVLVDLLLPIPQILGVSRTGFANYTPETDGFFRKARLFTDHEGKFFPSLPLAGLSVFLGKPPQDILTGCGIHTDEFNEIYINFFGTYKTFPYYSFCDAVNGKVPDEAFKGKIVLVGGTATALFDFKATTYSSIFPGVEMHANVIANLLRNNYLRPWSAWFTFLLILCLAFIPWAAMARFSPLKAGGVVLACFAAYFGVVYFLFVKQFVYAEFVAPAASLSFSYVGILFYRFMTEEKEKRWIKSTFSHYLSAHVMESILSDPGRLRLGGQRETLTVLFSDIRGFTTISEALKPEEVVELLNEYLSKMVEIVFKYDGTLDKFIGDAVMAFWGAPVAQKDHAKKAVLCAIEMIEELKKLQEKWRAEGKKIIEIGIGVNTGDMVVGNMGSKVKMEYTVIGDNVNLGSRLEGLNKEFKTHIIISDSTYQIVKDFIEVHPLGSVRVKGKEKPVEIYEVKGRK